MSVESWKFFGNTAPEMLKIAILDTSLKITN